ncbi:MAG: dTDP-4-dehydrorhamnose 3,5-epimerase [Candidatus Omnitrophica bacterium]|nr:dTDP-4-dehydrorhamnose 3,5-epimerase [Candidatus Omnitrophota bacterium]
MKFTKTGLSGVYLIEPEVFQDNRGLFVKTFHSNNFGDIGLKDNIKESFYSISSKNVIRGMHFQLPPKDHVKLLYVTAGNIIDVVLDIRKDSPTYGEHISVELSAINKKIIYIPSGFAHGFCALSENTIVVYMLTGTYSPSHDAGIRWDSFGMDWRIDAPVISDRDRGFPRLKDFDSPFLYKVQE